MPDCCLGVGCMIDRRSYFKAALARCHQAHADAISAARKYAATPGAWEDYRTAVKTIQNVDRRESDLLRQIDSLIQRGAW